ncbi:glycosyltransferase [Thermococcus nautili]|uniref:Glycosyltransferases involved in cell wall biogenesis n=1 Tax=Thermococcus nautili TaxID=195522 RepID=W8P3B4_9EURY|nr:glycosyltransferase [Thermococcus nautili]AHL23251.1 Glycosyltransferases involved in cell wall biogenesis [Thermococcus nautili]
MRVVVGIPSYNNAGTIGFVVRQAAEGLARYFGGGIIVNADGGSTDGTWEVVMGTEVPEGVEVHSFTYRWPIPGKGSAVKELMEFALGRDADVLVLVDSDLRSITPEWIRLLAEPIGRGYDFVAPLYLRHKWDGTITNGIAYPMTVSLYGRDVRQPIGGDFGLGRKLMELCLSEDVWNTHVARFGIDIFLTTTAIANGLRIVQAPLGVKVHDPKDPAQSLGPMFNQVVGTLFMLMGRYEDVWMNVRKIEPVPVFGDFRGGEPEPVNVTLELLERKARELFSQYERVLKRVLRPGTFEAVRGALRDFDFDDRLWSHVLYEGAAAYRKGIMGEAEPLIPLYFAKTADFVRRTLDASTEEAEKLVRERAKVFMEEKDYLLELWKNGEA